jgi:hypothetical protein
MLDPVITAAAASMGFLSLEQAKSVAEQQPELPCVSLH